MNRVVRFFQIILPIVEDQTAYNTYAAVPRFLEQERVWHKIVVKADLLCAVTAEIVPQRTGQFPPDCLVLQALP